MSKPFNGHRSWNAWNVALWVANDEPLYRLAIEYKRRHGVVQAARKLLGELPPKTPDGAPYTFTSLREAITGLE